MSEGSLEVRKEAWSGGDTRLARSVARPLTRFLAQEAASGVLLIVATVIALVWVNGWADSYHSFWGTELGVTFGDTELFLHEHHPFSLEFWVNDALMVLFFFVVGLEIKLEMVVGDLRNPRAAALPAIGAIGGMVVPALLYLLVSGGGDVAKGWGIPMATDIAFAVGVLTLLGPRVPQRLKLFLLTLAIADDIGAILVIAAFYSTGLSFGWLAASFAGFALILILRRSRVWYTPVYVVIGVLCWYAMLQSGVHATIAGVILGLLTPATPLLGERRFESIEDILSGDSASPENVHNANWQLRESVSVATRLIRVLSPWTSFLVVPLFALANAGVEISGTKLSDAVTSPVALGVFVGLVVGKPLGVTLFTLAATRFGLGSLRRASPSPHPWGVELSLVLGSPLRCSSAGSPLPTKASVMATRPMGILAASIAATFLGWLILRSAPSSEKS
ncbi:MAG: Na+/H+ antiporter NhaA [Acidimicrobiales bacterium]